LTSVPTVEIVPGSTRRGSKLNARAAHHITIHHSNSHALRARKQVLTQPFRKMSVVNIADVHPMQSLLLDHDIASRESDNINDRSHHPRTSCCSPRIRSNRGSCNVPSCTLCLLLGGILLGVSLPTNPDIPSHAWQILSNVIGYTYFLAWSSSFYPQIMLNYQRKKTNGLSVDFCVLNVLGYICYTVYTTNFYWNQNVISAYKDRTSGGDGAITVQGNDVAFSIHALVMASVTLCQVGVYDTFRARPPSRRTYIILFSVVTLCILYTLFMWMCRGRFDLLGFLYVLGTIKVGVTIGKYVPQALLNRSRKSTIGWNVRARSVDVLLEFLLISSSMHISLRCR
jgi:cystinosin